ncbi:putative type III secretion protein [Pseudomonas fluorescens]|uniref:Putative type III secretion protein n=1 Tax=Pseudomonas fluorescens TaxID=294 RepID=A0A379I8R9_PSEFL|nr:FliM/FliN family flagellar motor switch protein [Pseudomonas fluorescens]AIG04844.1 type III secretion protein [Pseudomonas fluorescens]SUD29168.1 putative type III secretion protein [Pseudomonas fluorescens]
MIMPALAIPSIRKSTVAARLRLGRGLSLSFQVADRHGELLLEPGRAPRGSGPIYFESARGLLAFSEPGPMFSLLGACPVTLAAAGNDPDSWFWELFQHHLSPQIRSLFGYLRLQPSPGKLTFGCRLTVTLGTSRVVGYLLLAPESLFALCEAGRWKPTAKPLLPSFQLAIAVTLGRLQLPITQLRRLREGDVLVLEQAFFDVQGTGQLRIGRHRLHGCIDDESGAMCLTLISIEEMSVDEEFSTQYYPGHDEDDLDEPVVDVFGHEPFDELSMVLNVRCGTLNLTLGELRNLAPGAVLSIAGYAPGMAGLYYGDRPIGLGQLVEVDGRLGLQLSRVVFAR